MGETDKDKEQEATKSLKSADSGGKKSSLAVSIRSQGIDGKKTPQTTSRQSGRVSFHGDKAIAEKDDRAISMAVSSHHGQKGQSPNNPFKLPSDADIFMLRDKERKRKKEERERQKHLRVHEKISKPLTTNFRKVALGIDETLDAGDEDNSLTVKDDPQFVLQVTRDRNIEKETLNEYVNKKREMFLVQYSLGVKRDEMRKLEEIAGAEEKKLELAEQYLEEDATMFDEFLKENDKNSVDAIKKAEAETKAKMEKVIEIKRLNAQMMSVKSEISKCEETLKEYLLYKKFLDSLSPKEWVEEREAERLARVEEKRRIQLADRRADAGTPSSGTAEVPRMKSKSGANLMSRSNTTAAGGAVRNPSRTGVQTEDDGTDSSDDIDENPQLYFSTPQQLLDIFSELEEQNLSLIQNSQETEEALEEMKQTMRSTSNKMEKETAILKEQINKLQSAIAREEEKAKDLKLKAQMFNFGEFKAEDQDSLIDELNKKVEEVYRACVGDNKANINTLQMLTNIENRLEELFEQIERLPPDRVEIAKKEKERERRLKMREEKMEQQRIHQEERVKKALERAQAEAIKKTGRRLVGRSQPPKMTQRTDKNADLISKEEEELAYYFNP